MSILLPTRPLLQPQGAARINWSSPLSRGLIGAFLPDSPVNLVDGEFMYQDWLPPTVGVRGQSGGRVLKGGIYTYQPSSVTFPYGYKFDLTTGAALIVASQSSAQNSNIGIGRASSSGTQYWGIGLHGGSFNGAYGAWGTFNFTPSTSGVSTLQKRTVVINADGSTATLYMDGGMVSSGAYTMPAYDSSVRNRCFAFGSTAAGQTSNAATIEPSLGLVWNRPLSPYEVAQLTENPWQIFESQQRKRLIVDFGSAPTTGWTYKVRQAPIQQPASPVVNEGHPMSSGLMAWQTGYASSGFTEINTAPVVSGAHGFARRFAYLAGDANAHYLALQRTRRTASGAATIATLLRVNSSYTTEGSYQVPVALSRAVITDYIQLELSVSGGVGSWSFKLSASGVNAGLSVPYTVGDEQWHFIVCRQSHPTYRDIWIDGVNVAQQVGSSNPANLNYAYVGASALSTSISGWAGDIALALFWNRGLTDNEMRSLSKNPWQLFQQPRRIHASTKIYRPYSDITTTGWTARPDAPYFRQLAETVPSDSNYIFSPDPSGSPGAFVAGLNASMEAGTYNIKFRARKTTSAGQIRATLLDASGSSVGASGWISLTTGFADYTATVTSSAPAARIKLEVQP